MQTIQISLPEQPCSFSVSNVESFLLNRDQYTHLIYLSTTSTPLMLKPSEFQITTSLQNLPSQLSNIIQFLRQAIVKSDSKILLFSEQIPYCIALTIVFFCIEFKFDKQTAVEHLQKFISFSLQFSDSQWQQIDALIASYKPSPSISVEKTNIENLVSTVHSADLKSKFYCKNCRYLLFQKENIVEHTQGGDNKKDFSTKKLKKDVQNLGKANLVMKITCSAFYLEQMAWMGELNDMEGKINCPKCTKPVGSYKWTGDQCSCGVWVTPSIKILKSKLDFVE